MYPDCYDVPRICACRTDLHRPCQTLAHSHHGGSYGCGDGLRRTGKAGIRARIGCEEGHGECHRPQFHHVQLGHGVGPAVAGLVYALFGPAWCFLVNAVSFVAIIVALLMMRIDLGPKKVRKISTIAELREGLRYAFHEPMIRTIIIVVGATSLFGFSFATLIPAWAVKILNGDAVTNGYLQSARGVGALLSALMIASLSHYDLKGKLLTAGTLVFPVLLFAFSFARWFPLSLLLMLGVGAALIQIMNLANALVQSLVPDHLRGRVMGLYGLTFFGLMPLGALWVGMAAEHLGEPVAVMIGAGLSLAVAFLVFLRVPALRRLP